VKNGVELVEKTGAALQGILGRVDDLQTMIEGVSSANCKQLDHHAEMESFVTELGEASRSSQRLVEARTLMIEQITEEAELITGIVRTIKTRGQENPRIERFIPGNRDKPSDGVSIVAETDVEEDVAPQRPRPRAVAAGGGSAAVAVQDDWDEF